MDENKVVYLHKDVNGVVRYVGSGTLRRAYHNYSNSDKGEKYSEYVATNGKLEVDVVARGLSKVEAENLERELYDKYQDTVLNVHRPSSPLFMSKEMFEKYLYYDENSESFLRWNVNGEGRGGHNIRRGSKAGSLSKSTGYYQVRLKGKLYKVHRIVAMLHGIDVNGKVIDHIDRNRANNKISNLRVVTEKENSQNRSLGSGNTSGVQGVSYHKRRNSWVATWYEEGKLRTKSFPISKYQSSEESFNAAVEYRKQMLHAHYPKKERSNYER